MEKTAQLGEALSRLGVKEAQALARAVELGRLRGKEDLPTDLVLAALRPRLREIGAGRLPTLRRLVCAGFEQFLTDTEDDPRRPGRIPRAVIVPWWQACDRIAGDDMRALERRLTELYQESDAPDREDVARDAQAAAAAWTQTLVTRLANGGDAALRQLFPRRAQHADVKEIATILAMAEPLTAALIAVERALAGAGMLNGRRIVELTPDAVTVAKQHYQALSDTHGMGSAYLALALLNRLQQPRHIMRLGRALSWKNDDSLIRDTEFAVVGERLIADLQLVARDVAATAGTKGGGLPDLSRLAAALAVYMDEVEGLLGEFGFRRDSPWGEAILQTRMTISAAFDRDFLGRVAERAILGPILPTQRRAAPTRGADAQPATPPSEDAVATATAAARLFFLLVQRGARHGLAQLGRETIETVTVEIDLRTASLLDGRQATPGSAAEAQIVAASQILDILSEDGRGEILLRRMRIATQVSA